MSYKGVVVMTLSAGLIYISSKTSRLKIYLSSRLLAPTSKKWCSTSYLGPRGYPTYNPLPVLRLLWKYTYKLRMCREKTHRIYKLYDVGYSWPIWFKRLLKLFCCVGAKIFLTLGSDKTFNCLNYPFMSLEMINLGLSPHILVAKIYPRSCRLPHKVVGGLFVRFRLCLKFIFFPA